VIASTGVPRECVVVPSLVRFIDIDDGIDRWADAAIAALEKPRSVTNDNRLVAASAFSIESSARALERLYGKGLLT
jgi:hypothetical protein